MFRYLIANAGVGVPEILHSGQSLFTDMVGGKPLGLTVCWINRRGIDLHPSVSAPDHIFPDIRSLLPLLGIYPRSPPSALAISLEPRQLPIVHRPNRQR